MEHNPEVFRRQAVLLPGLQIAVLRLQEERGSGRQSYS
jgi:hypothetical protein